MRMHRTWLDFWVCIALSLFLGVLMYGCEEARAEVVIDMDAIMQIESSGRELAHNKASGARGLFQLTPICIEDFNQVNGTHYRPQDAFDPQIAYRVAYWYLNERIPSLLKHYRRSDTVNNRLWAYNAGIGRVLSGKMSMETVNYIAKYERLTK